MIKDVIIIGAGPAGLTAGIYCARFGLKTLILEKLLPGGQAIRTYRIENYPGFAEEISGIDLIKAMEQQAKKFGAEIATAEAQAIELQADRKIIISAYQKYWSRAIIIATGNTPQKLPVANADFYVGKGLSYCAICDGPFFKDKIVAVIGGGDSALAESIYLASLASRVYIVHRRNEFRASKILQDQIKNIPNIILVLNSVIDQIVGENRVEAIKIKNTTTERIEELKVDGIFVYIGFVPNSDFVKSLITLDDNGYIITDENLSTNIHGIWAIGDVRRKSLRQIATAVGDGALAAYEVYKFLNK
ncbi:MAG: thioredoxin-disulfide reductase [candidate division WOR-3 bacterium]|nr:thioredoxin-disulfide reductase [candidate division WOR-3 bacterium]